MGRRTKKADPSLAVAFIRVSTDTKKQGLSPRAQAKAIRRWAERNGVRIVRWRVEAISGGADLTKRTKLLQALAEVTTLGAGHLLVKDMTRFTRDATTAVLAQAELAKAGAQVTLAEGQNGDDPQTKLMRHILVGVAEFEKAMIGARIRAALQVKRAKGEKLGGKLPYGYRLGANGKRLVKEPSEQATLRFVQAKRAEGLSIRQIIEAAAEAGHLNRHDKPFSVRAMHNMVKDVRKGGEDA